MTRPRRPGRGVGPLAVLLALLVGSAAIRIAAGAGPALARELASPPAEEEPMACAADPELAPILERLGERERTVSAAEDRLAERRIALEAAERMLTGRLAELQAAEASLAATVKGVGAAAETDLAQLTSVYESMKPKDAAPLFEAMKPDFAAGFLGRMRPDAAASVMALMAPEKAYAISVILAGRNATVPRP
jgi:flagellar motility protein MotE (MotC chaperone)